MYKLAELMVGDESLAVLAEVQLDEVAVAVELDLMMERRVSDHLLELL